MNIKTQGIVLTKQKYSDSKVIVNIFTKASGKKTFMVAIGKRKKQLINLMQPFFILDLIYNDKQNSNFLFLKEASLLYPFNSVSSEYVKISIVMFLTEFLTKITEQGIADTELFDFVKTSILLLENCSSPANFHLGFLSSLSLILGIMPQMNFSEQRKYFNLQQARFVETYTKDKCLSKDVSKNFFNIFKSGIKNFSSVRLNRQQRKELLTGIINYYTFNFPTVANLKTLDVLELMFD